MKATGRGGGEESAVEEREVEFRKRRFVDAEALDAQRHRKHHGNKRAAEIFS